MECPHISHFLLADKNVALCFANSNQKYWVFSNKRFIDQWILVICFGMWAYFQLMLNSFVYLSTWHDFCRYKEIHCDCINRLYNMQVGQPVLGKICNYWNQIIIRSIYVYMWCFDGYRCENSFSKRLDFCIFCWELLLTF